MSKYNTVEAHIDYIRERLREVSDDSNYTDELIYKMLLDARAVIIERRLKKGKQLPDFMYQEVCMPLCIDTYHDCDCVPGLGCEVLKTKYELPNGFYNGQAEVLRVSTLIGEEIAPSTEARANYRQFKKTGKNRMYYIRVNDRLAIFNRLPKPLKTIKIRAIFEDPIAASSINNCNREDDADCVDVLGTGFNTKVSDNIAIYDIVLQQLGISKQMPEDRISDTVSTPKQNQI